jgi:hypothetical protein
MDDIEQRIWSAHDRLREIGTPRDPDMRLALQEISGALATLSDLYTEVVDELAAARGTYR